jgi:hypothetical protein
MAGWRPVPALGLELEMEAYDAAVSPDAATAATWWRFGSLSLGARWSVM